MALIQLDFFRDDDISIIRQELDRLKSSNDRLRKALFARHGELAKKYMDVHERLSIIERHICTGGF
jgi:hypothetical protein